MTNDLALLQGVWTVTSLEMDARRMTAPDLDGARIEVSGSRFTSTGMGAVYDGTLTVDTSAKPRRLDMKFDSGPEKGNTNLAIYEINGDEWKLCIATRGSSRPRKFAAPADTGIALETLRRGTAKPRRAAQKSAPAAVSAGSPGEIDGEWTMVSAVMDGKPMDDSMVKWVSRTMQGGMTIVTAGPQTMLKAAFTHDSARQTIDYVLLAGPQKGKKQLGTYKLEANLLSICMGAPGKPRAVKLASFPGDGSTFTVWRRK